MILELFGVGSRWNMPVHIPVTPAYSLWDTKEPTSISTEKALMEQEADLSRGMELDCFYSNLCKWACLHYSGFLCEWRSERYQSIEPWGPECGLQRLYCTWHWRRCVRKTECQERETGMCTRQRDVSEKAFWYKILYSCYIPLPLPHTSSPIQGLGPEFDGWQLCTVWQPATWLVASSLYSQYTGSLWLWDTKFYGTTCKFLRLLENIKYWPVYLTRSVCVPVLSHWRGGYSPCCSGSSFLKGKGEISFFFPFCVIHKFRLSRVV